jgi:hypothetical protein
MSLPQHPSRPLEFPVFANIAAIEADNVRVMVERADALLKAQDDGLKAMEARMASLFAQAVTLASAAVIGTATASLLLNQKISDDMTIANQLTIPQQFTSATGPELPRSISAPGQILPPAGPLP